MSYTIVYTRIAYKDKDIKKLDIVVKKKLKKKIEEFSKKPRIHAKKLTSPKIGTYRRRIGNYLVVFDLDKKILSFFELVTE